MIAALILWTGLSAAAEIEQADAARREGLDAAAQGRAEEAYGLLAPWVDTNPQDTEAAGVLAAVAAQTGRVEVAEALLAALPQDDPRLALLGADLALQRGEPRVAIQRLAAHWPEPPPALEREFRRILGQAYVETAQPDAALEALEGATGDPVLVLWRSRALFQDGRMEEAVEALAPFVAQILEGNVGLAPAGQRPLIGEILVDYARGLVAVGRATEAVAVLEPTVVELSSRRAWDALAQALVAAGRGDEARAALNRGAALLSRDP